MINKKIISLIQSIIINQDVYNVVKCINDIDEISFNFANYFLLSGDYLKKTSLKFLSYSNKVANALIENTEALESSVGDLVNSYSKRTENLNQLVKLLSDSVNKNQIVDLSSSAFIKHGNIIDNESPQSKIAFINARICFYDHFLSIKQDQLHELILFKGELEKSEYRSVEVTQVILDKTNYLIYKILFRLLKDDEKYRNVYNLQGVEISFNELAEEVGVYNKFLSISKEHYQGSVFVGANSHARDIKANLARGSVVSARDFHFLVKYSKDLRHNNTELEFINTAFQNHNNTQVKSNGFEFYNNNVYNINKNYIYNNLLSGLIDDADRTSPTTKIEEVVEDIINLQEVTNIQNYFPHFKYANYLVEIIENQLDNILSENINFMTIENLINKLNKTISLCHKSYEWCKKNNYNAFALPYNECIIETSSNINIRKLFLASSFVLPLNYKEVKIELKKIDSKYNRVKTLTKFNKNALSIKKRIDQQEASITKDIIDRDRKQIEILGVFAAIVLFSISEVQIFTKVSSIIEAIIFSIAFAYSLGVFIILLWILTRNYSIKISWIHWSLIGLFILITSILYYTLIMWELTNGLSFK